MTKNTFKRGLGNKLLMLLTTKSKMPDWWQAILEDKELVIAVRDNYLNVYHNGNSLMKISERDNKLICDIHYKYLLSSTENNPYIKFENSVAINFDLPARASLLTNQLTEKTLANLKKSAKVYGGLEKEGVHKIILSNTNIIDTEIAFSLTDKETNKTKALRIDFAALRKTAEGQTEIVFYEAKHYTNKELFSSSDTPQVVKQIKTYESNYIKELEAEILTAYRSAIKDLQRITGGFFNELPTAVHPNVKLVIFGYDNDQKTGANFKNRIEKLQHILGKENLLLKGDAKNFRAGISD